MISSRYEFHKLLKQHNLKGKGIEIGVGRGEFSKHLLELTELEKIYSIDPWDISKSQYRSKWTQEKLNEVYELAMLNLKPFGSRSKVVKSTSAEALKMFDDKSIDFIYIDALHDYESVKQDIELWWPKVKSGGILAGHDYTKRIAEKEKDAEFGVIKAVNESVKELNVNLNVTNGDRFPSWYFRKPFAMY
jgi:hypothetical protein